MHLSKCFLLVIYGTLSYGCSNGTKNYSNIIYKTERKTYICSKNCKNNNKTSKKYKKILILTNPQGGGHIIASHAIKDAIEQDYDIVIMDILKNRMHGEDVFSFLSTKESWKLLSFILSLKELVSNFYSLLYFNDIKKDIINENPDIIISDFPILNNKYWEIAKSINKPFAITPTDFNIYDLKHWGIPDFSKATEEKYKPYFKYFASIPLDHKDKNILVSKNVSNNVKYIGFPVRKDFLDTFNSYNMNDKKAIQEIQAIKEQHKINAEDRTLLISLGAQSFMSKAILEYLQYIDEALSENKVETVFSGKLHVLVACGKNKALKDNLIEYNGKSQRLDIIPLEWLNAKQMAQYMIISDVIIGKPGGAFSGEALAIGINKFLLKPETVIMSWEKENLEMLSKLNIGTALPFRKDKNYKQNFIEQLFNKLNNSSKTNDNKKLSDNHFFIDIKTAIDQWLEELDKQNNN